MRVSNDLLANAQDGSSSFNTAPVSVEHMACAAAQCVWTGTLAGTIQVQASCDPGTDSQGANIVTWISLSGGSLAPAGSAGNGMLALVDMGYRWVRLTWTRTSGTGNLSIRLHAKGV